MSLSLPSLLSKTRLLTLPSAAQKPLFTTRAISTTSFNRHPSINRNIRAKYATTKRDLSNTSKMFTTSSTASTNTSSSQQPSARVKSLDHLVLTVTSIHAAVTFYTTHLGMTHETFSSSANLSTAGTSPDQSSSSARAAAASAAAPTRHALRFGDQKINLHQAGSEFEPRAGRVMPGSGDLCFLTDEPVEGVCDRLKMAGVEVLEGGGVVGRTGARRGLRSVYVRDPDGNLVE